jgi:uncharacterized protein YuzE
MLRRIIGTAEIDSMSAGSSPDTGNQFTGPVVPITESPVVEIDTEAMAEYIRLRESAVARTEPFASERALIMLDPDAEDNVIGIEVVGQQEFSIRELIKLIPVQTTESVLDRTRYVSAKPQAARIGAEVYAKGMLNASQ